MELCFRVPAWKRLSAADRWLGCLRLMIIEPLLPLQNESRWKVLCNEFRSARTLGLRPGKRARRSGAD